LNMMANLLGVVAAVGWLSADAMTPKNARAVRVRGGEGVELGKLLETAKNTLRQLVDGLTNETAVREYVEDARERARREQCVEDFNVRQRFAGLTCRALFLVPVTDAFDVTSNPIARGKLQNSDRVSMPASLGAEILQNRVEVPWHFQIQPLLTTKESTGVVDCVSDDGSTVLKKIGAADHAKLCCSPIDFRAPENYLFVPLWMFRHLGLEPFDLVLLTQVRLVEGVSLQLRPNKAFSLLAQPRVVLESELKYYSSAILGSTIHIKFQNELYDLKVEDCLGNTAASTHAFEPARCHAISLQDADVELGLLGLDRAQKP